jgi:hypothetical protein
MSGTDSALKLFRYQKAAACSSSFSDVFCACCQVFAADCNDFNVIMIFGYFWIFLDVSGRVRALLSERLDGVMHGHRFSGSWGAPRYASPCRVEGAVWGSSHVQSSLLPSRIWIHDES